MVTYDRTIGTSSRDYSTFTAAEAAVPSIVGSSDLDTATAFVDFEAFNDSAFDETVTISGLTTSATWHVRYRAADADRHDGTIGNGVRIVRSSQGFLLDIRDSHTEWIGISHSYSVSNEYNITALISEFGSDTVGTLIDRCLFEQTGGDYETSISLGGNECGESGAPTTIRNTAFYGAGNDSWGVSVNGANSSDVFDHYIDLVNCSFRGQTYAFQLVRNNASQSFVLNIVNTWAGGTASANYNVSGASGTVTTTGCVGNFGDDSTWPGLATPNPVTVQTATGSGDLLIYTSASNHALVDHADNDVLGQSVGPASNSLVSTEDILGNARSGSTADPGAFQVTTAGGGGQNVNVPAVSAALTILALAGINQTVDVPVSAVATSIVAPDVAVDQTVSVPVSGATLSIVAPDQTDLTVPVGVASLTSSTLAPAVASTLDVAVPVSSATLAALAPDVNAGQLVSVPATAATLSIVAPVQTDRTVDVSTATLVTSVLAPDVNAGQLVSVPAASATLSVVAPVQTDRTVAVGTATLVASVLAPSLDSGQLVSVPVASATLSVFAPVQTDRTVNVDPSVLVTSILAPSLGGDQEIPVPVSTAALTVVSPLIKEGNSAWDELLADHQIPGTMGEAMNILVLNSRRAATQRL